jgi:hypothetical protein
MEALYERRAHPPQNKSPKLGVFSMANLAPSSHHVFTTKSPQITTNHHAKTTIFAHVFSKPP